MMTTDVRRFRARAFAAAAVRWLAAGAIAATLAVGPAGAQDSALADRLERDINDLQRQLYRGEAPAAVAPGAATAAGGGGLTPNLATGFELRLTDVENQMRGLTGSLEELGFQIRQIGERLDKLVGDVDFRLQALEQGRPVASGPGGGEAFASSGSSGSNGLGAAGGSVQQLPELAIVPPPPSVSIVTPEGSVLQPQAGAAPAASTTASLATTNAAPRPVLPEGSPEERYKFAFSLLRQTDYAQAERALAAFVAAHPDHALAGNAQYWLGETFYVRGLYQQAAVAFADGFQNYNESVKAPDNLLKLGMALASLGKSEEACTAFQELGKRYPDASAAIAARAQRERQRNRC